jgi:hypothetical protein
VIQLNPVCGGLHLRLGWCSGSGVIQLYPNALRLAAPQCDRGVTDAHDKGVASRARLGEDLDLLAVNETELEETPLERREGRCTRADAHHATPGTRREGREAHEARRAAQTFRDGDSVHAAKYE